MGGGNDRKCWNCVWFKRLNSYEGQCTNKNNAKVNQNDNCPDFHKK